MTTAEMIRKYSITLAEKDGQEALRVSGKLTQAVKNQILSVKPAILAELKRLETERKERAAAKKAVDEAEKRAIMAGEKTIVLHWHDGEYLSGYEVLGQVEARLLEDLGLARYVDGWGHHVPQVAISALGTEFAYPAAVEYTRPAREAKAAKEAAQATALAQKFALARETGKPVEISRFMAECNDSREECSTDLITVLAMPDGTEKTTRQHTW